MESQENTIQNRLLPLSSISKLKLIHLENNSLTGFCFIDFPENYFYESKDVCHFYVLFVLSGSISLTSPLYSDKLVTANQMAFVSKYWKYSFHVLEESEILIFAFDIPIIKTDSAMLDYYCSTASKGRYVFNTLPINNDMQSLVDMVVTQLKSGLIHNNEICYSWNNLFFIFLVSHYPLDSVVNFMRPVLSGTVDFRSFVENNYLEVDGKVERLISLSGMSRKAFNLRFQKEYGVSAKTWLVDRFKLKLMNLAAQDHIAPKDLASALGIKTIRLCKMTRTYFNCTPNELIANAKKNINNN